MGSTVAYASCLLGQEEPLRLGGNFAQVDIGVAMLAGLITRWSHNGSSSTR